MFNKNLRTHHKSTKLALQQVRSQFLLIVDFQVIPARQLPIGPMRKISARKSRAFCTRFYPEYNGDNEGEHPALCIEVPSEQCDLELLLVQYN